MAENTIIKSAVQQRFDSFIQRGRVLFVSAPCGFGKSTLANALLEGRNVLRLSAGAPDFSLDELPEEWDILLIDDFQQLPEEHEEQTLCQLIRSGSARHFVLLSRGAVPSYLTAFQYAGLMTTLEADDLLFDREDIRRYFALSDVPITDSEISGLLKGSIGYPLGIAVTARCMSGGKPFGPEVAARVLMAEGGVDVIYVNQIDGEDFDPALTEPFVRAVDCPVVVGSLRQKRWKRLR